MWQAIPMAAMDAGGRLDQVLARRLGASRGRVRRLLQGGGVRLNGRVVDESAKGRPVASDDRIEVADQAMQDAPRPAADMPLDLVGEGEGWLIVNKPAGTPVHPLRPGEMGTVLSAVVARHPQIVGVGEGGLRSGVVHRLDVDTTGCLLFATDQAVWERLRRAFHERRVEKVYHALVRGRLEGSGDAAMHLAVTRHRPAHVVIVDAAHHGARLCTLAWRCLATGDRASLVEVRLGTGFLHQIRAMLAHRGHPLLGDLAYGGPGQVVGEHGSISAARPMLHARSLRTGDVAGQVDPPADFREVARLLGLATA